MKEKTIYRGIFNYERSVEKPMYRYAYTEREAWKIMCDELAKRYNVHPSHVYAIFDGSKQNFEITVEIEFKEA